MRTSILHKATLAIICALLLGGCGIYRPYGRPSDINAPERYRTDQITGTDEELSDSGHLGQTDWRDLFSDIKLQALIERGLDSNFDLRNAVLQVRQMQARLAQARLAFTPGLNVNGSETYSGIVNQSDPANSFSIGAGASWEIDIFGKLLNAKRGSVAALLQSEAARRSVKTQVIASIATAYYSLLMLDRQLEISRQTVTTWDASIKVMEALKTAGSYNQAAIEQARANSLAVKAGIPDLTRQIRELENSLSLLAGMDGQPIDRTRLEDQRLPSRFSVGVPSQMFLDRPDILQAEAQLMAAYANTAAARAAFLPGFRIAANGNWTYEAGSAILDPARFVWNAVASLALPVFNMGANRANLRVAKAQYEITANNFKKTLLNAANEISNALFLYQAAGEKLQYRAQQVEGLEKAVSYTTQLMNLGGTYLEVLTAQQSLLQAQLAQVSAQYERMDAVVALYRALGGGAQEEVAGIDTGNYNRPKSVRKRTKAIEQQVKELVKEEKAARKAAKKGDRE
ncbi:MAG: efflux transporter outer membrane subunit [Bacteroides sp.]|nr:efflux transporter outer membrane subunit [Ruminococcus flavefaciens]MCM1555745.1 efflux transporter outer membrane subunit [Bacteroides sp.]